MIWAKGAAMGVALSRLALAWLGGQSLVSDTVGGVKVGVWAEAEMRLVRV